MINFQESGLSRKDWCQQKDFTKEQLKKTTAYQAMEQIGIRYKIEEMIRDRSPEERYEERQKQVKLLLEASYSGEREHKHR